MDLLLGLFFGAVGTAFFLYGKRQHEPVYYLAGAFLLIYPWFVSNLVLVLLLGIIATALPIAWHRGLL